MTYEEAVTLTDGLRERGNASFSPSEKGTIKRLYSAVLGKTFRVTSCQRCYHDAVIEIALYLRKNKKMEEKKNYELRAGYIIHTPEFHDGKIFTNDNLTDEVAAEYLKKYPQKARFFARIPEETAETAANEPKNTDVASSSPKERKPRKLKNSKK